MYNLYDNMMSVRLLHDFLAAWYAVPGYISN